MTFVELIKKMKPLPFQECRAEGADFFEAVLGRDNFGIISEALESHFGVPAKPEGVEPSAQVRGYADPHGGVRGNQIFYLREMEEVFHGAMIWPWSDGVTLTLKMMQGPRMQTPPPGKQGWIKKIFGN